MIFVNVNDDGDDDDDDDDDDDHDHDDDDDKIDDDLEQVWDPSRSYLASKASIHHLVVGIESPL